MPHPQTGPELLSPAGSPEAAYAAFRYGADAIYCGLRRFSARAEAVNFTLEELREIVAYAHGLPRPRRVFVTLNTVIPSSELADTAETLVAIADAGADAVIVQDLGVFRLAERLVPALERHASTQMAIHNVAGVRAAVDMGFAQVTLARELTLEEVRAVAAAGVRTEVFIHGALCYSYSGLCLMSSHRSSRSGNRGRCAYPCRERYGLEGGDAEGLAFSMKDLALGADVRELAAAGVACLKIEGRMKGALYVAAVTDFYRRLLDGTLTREQDIRAAEDDLRTVFSRPWTKLSFRNAKGHDGIDSERTGNRGLPIGSVEAVFRDDEGGRWLQFRTERALELHDGLQFDLPGMDRPYGFAIERFGGDRAGRAVFERPQGSVVHVALPPDAPLLPEGTTVSCTSSQAVKQRYPTPIPPASERKPRQGIAVRVAVTATAVEAQARTSSGDAEATARVEGAYGPAKDGDRMRATVFDVFGKLGETGFHLESLEQDNPEGRFVPMSHLNGLRRALCDALDGVCAHRFAQRVAEARTIATTRPPSVVEDVPERWLLKTDDVACLAEIEDADEIVLELEGVTDEQVEDAVARFGHEKLRLALPVIVRAWETDALQRRLQGLLARGHRRWLATNLAAWKWLPAGLDLVADWTLTAMNPQAVAAWRALGASGVTLSPEDTRDGVAELLGQCGPQATVVLYQDTPLMVSESCPVNALQHGCQACPAGSGVNIKHNDPLPSFVPTRGGDAVRAVLRGCRATLVNERPFCWADRLTELRALGGRSWRVDFSLRRYRAEEAADVWRTVRAGRAVRGTHAGNWNRELL